MSTSVATSLALMGASTPAPDFTRSSRSGSVSVLPMAEPSWSNGASAGRFHAGTSSTTRSPSRLVRRILAVTSDGTCAAGSIDIVTSA